MARSYLWCCGCLIVLVSVCLSQWPTLYAYAADDERQEPLKISWHNNLLTIRGHFPGEVITVNYLEAYCRPGSTDRDWQETVIGHHTELVASGADQRSLHLKCTLRDGVQVEHVITASNDEVDFRLKATNPTTHDSQAHWAQPCIRVDRFTNTAPRTYDYLGRCFVYIDGQLSRMPTKDWNTRARYTPGQVWVPKHVPRDDVNPRPVNPHAPSLGLIGCFSQDERWVMATAFEPYQELFQGVITCLHADFRLGGLKAGETKHVRGKIYIMPADIDRLLSRYRQDFPEHFH
ncbi:MAG: hypothetical protein KatS3mg113_0712 [Planctomycetaceae bacterium]|nr:MAG: hypothetical protein KatS3mg113_0712 [Planctomycetaceae bacterium]